MVNSPDAQRELFSMFLESQYWPRDAIEQHQNKRLDRLVRHACQHVPFHRDRLSLLVDATSRVDLSRWSDIPLLTRADLMQPGLATTSQALPPGHGEPTSSTTSGSTGAPLTVWSSGYANAATVATLHRCQSWHELDWSRDVLFWTEERPDSGVWPDVEIGVAWGPSWLEQSTGRFLRFNGDTPAGNILDFLRAHGNIRYLSCRAKVAQVLALESERVGRSVALEGVFAFSTATHADERDDIARALGAKIISLYSSKEAHLMAYQCPHGHGLHINEELVLVELLDDDNRPVPKGRMGRVVVTNLFNWAQPLIRYVQGDFATEGEPCSCGRSLRVLSSIAGRVTDMFRFPDGHNVAFALPENTKRELNIKTWQVAQIAPLQIEVRYQPLSDRAVDEATVAAAIRSRTHPAVVITFRQTTDFLPADGRKFAEYVNELPHSPA
jgi:phenylacetate-CoA ligase